MEKSSLSVSQLNNYIKGVFDDEIILKSIAVFGEVSEVSPSGGHLFFTLKDENSILRCVRFGGGFNPEIGDTVLALGSVEYYAKGNRVSFQAKEIKPVGEGAIKRAFNELVEKLKKEGLFENRPKLPRFIKKVGIITSETGAVIHDFTTVIYKAHPYIDILLYPVKVQGEGAEQTIANAIISANENPQGCDILVIARGGGANSDLDTFNTEIIARAVSASKIPVISAIGHQVDYTLCDLCATLRAGTPSIAGENICRINESFIARFYENANKLSLLTSRAYAKHTARALSLVSRITDCTHEVVYKNKGKIVSLLNRMSAAVQSAYNKELTIVENNYERLNEGVERSVSEKSERLAALTQTLNAVNPLKLIKSGYAKVYLNNAPIRSVREVSEGDEIEVLASDGIIEAVAKKIKSRTGEV